MALGIIGITHAGSLDAAELGALLKDLSADYKKVTGGRLVLDRYETGSSWIHLKDALAQASAIAGQVSDIAGAVEHMVKFAKVVKGFFQKAKGSKPTVSASQLEKVVKSMTRLTRYASERNAALEVDYNADHKSGTESLKVRMTPFEVRHTHEELKFERETAHHFKETLPQLAPPESEDKRVAGIARQFVLSSGASTSEMEALVAAIVSALQLAGSAGILPMVADNLDANGQHEIAAMIRRHLPPSQQRLLVPEGY